ncbi:hypothetical protein H4R33_001391 [Dimargaris cristalligena]|uniref:Acyl-CoA dehydrogenase/oxidase n=1 Tax=Dimargaris cristalligena TaxID=215637 RepID=A0A4Q0A173_9FUNG|nr:hypothetical protein H4R33_001391 [Dimargaris cristalligena]RKP39856.1 acyl-CoA dehydrogenase/oxidase [Dimargaris cristalligena]|eukprot:RKP39856.1 acyl-CoA dehydrogenase/oxidase [Dimargaris cristalligena]
MTSNYGISPKAQRILKVLKEFVENDCIPAEATFNQQIGKGEARFQIVPPVLEQLKVKAKTLGLWNLFLGEEEYGTLGAGLTNFEYALMAEQMGRSIRLAPEACNCSAPDTGNMEVLAKYGSDAQKQRWLTPLLAGEIRSAFAMTEPNVASSDATNIGTSIVRDEKTATYLINGHKWWITGAGDPRCQFFFVVGQTNPSHPNPYQRQSVVLVPAKTPGVKVVRPLEVFGYDDAPSGHCEVTFENVRVPVDNIILGEGRGFEVLQGRLGPGRLHHCMRAIGLAERAMDLTLARITSRTAFGRKLAENAVVMHQIATCRMNVEQARLLVLHAAGKMDRVGPKGAQREIAIAKIRVPNLVLKVIDDCIQMHGAAGVGADLILAEMYAGARTLRIADGPDDVHLSQFGRNEIKKYLAQKAKL